MAFCIGNEDVRDTLSDFYSLLTAQALQRISLSLSHSFLSLSLVHTHAHTHTFLGAVTHSQVVDASLADVERARLFNYHGNLW